MTTQEDALIGLAAFLGRGGIPYMVIGGLANIVWGEPRATLDIDVTVWVPDAQLESFVDRVGQSYRVLVDAPLPFIRAARVLPIETTTGVRIDLVLGLLPFEREAIDRARDLLVAGTQVRFCTPEDLVLMKIISDRDRDLADARALVLRLLPTLDLHYLEPRIIELARLLKRPAIEERWSEWTRGTDTGTTDIA
jgi:hypothetical protein